MSPTTTEELPPLIARASGAWICTMSHWRPERVSFPGAGAPGAGSGAASAAAAPSSTRVAKRPVAETPSRRLSRATVEAKASESDDAMATPIWSYA